MHQPQRNTPVPKTTQTSRLRLAGAMVLIFAATCAAYAPVIHAKFVWDDDAHTTKPELRSWHGLGRIWVDVGATQQYYPLLHSFFWIQWQLWGDHPLGYHLINVLLHATAASLVFLILRKLAIPGALLAAAIFALHPVMVESVAWITEQKNTLSAVFYLSAMLAYLHFEQARKPALYFAALALFILGLLSKTVTATLPAALLVILWWQRGSLSWRRDVMPLVPWFVLGIGAGLFTAWVERNFIGAEGAEFDLTLVQRCLLAGRVIWFYVGKLLWPTNLTFIYPRWQVNTQTWQQWLFPLGAIVLLIVLWLLRRRWRAPLAAWLFFVGTLFPVLGFFNVYPFVFSFVADHFQYLASLGLIVWASSCLTILIARLPPNWRPLGPVLAVALLGTLAVLANRQTEMYGDVVTLYQTTIDRNPASWMSYQNLGNVYARSNRIPEAIAYFQQALTLNPDFAAAHNDLASALMLTGRQQDAIEQYQQALQLKPNYVLAHYNLGNLLLGAGRTQEAIEHFQQAVSIDPDYVEARNSLGVALAQKGDFEDAAKQFTAAIQLRSDYLDAYSNLTIVYSQLHRLDDAVATAQKALEVAQSTGQTACAERIENWLKTYRAGQGNDRGDGGSSK